MSYTATIIARYKNKTTDPDSRLNTAKITIRHESTKLNRTLPAAVGINMHTTVEIVCHVVVAPHFPRSLASEMNGIMQFAERNGAIELSFDDNRTF